MGYVSCTYGYADCWISGLKAASVVAVAVAVVVLAMTRV